MNVKAGVPLLAAMIATGAQGATIAIMDSGTDIKHQDLEPRVWLNPGETPDNEIDDDGDGYVDDVYGWNFAENNNQVIDYRYVDRYSEDCYKFFEIQGRILDGTATDEDKAWIEKKRADPMFLQELQSFGTFVHGSHVAGIASQSRTTEILVSAKIIPTSNPGWNPELRRLLERIATEESDPITDFLIKFFLDQLIDQQASLIVSAGNYVGYHKAQVVNGSFGMSHANVGPLVKALLGLTGKEPTEEEVKHYTNYAIGRMNEKFNVAIEAASNTLFVFAAGNDGTDNDDMHVAPANSGLPNTIAVAATLGRSKLASFSNFGDETVHVAAPGVGIESTIPGNKYLRMSGTSMAAPYVAHAAAVTREANPDLSVADVKRILLETVDKKDFLEGKVVSGGIVNPERAVLAATLAKEMSVDEAIRKSLEEVRDLPDPRVTESLTADAGLFVLPLPSLLPTSLPPM